MFILAAVVAVATALAVTPDASAHAAWKHEAGELKTPLLHEIKFYRSETQRLLLAMGEKRYPVAYAEQKRPEWRPWISELWRGRLQEARKEWKTYSRSWEAMERDWHRALMWAANRFGVDYGWIHTCNHNEGGHGWVM